MKSFVHLVNQNIKNRNLSIRKLARELDLDASFFSKVLSGKRSPPRDEKTLRKLAGLLDLDPLLLIVSTGTIPSELQPIMEDENFLRSLKSGRPAVRTSAPAPSPAPAPRQSAYKSRPPENYISVKKEISEDLL